MTDIELTDQDISRIIWIAQNARDRGLYVRSLGIIKPASGVDAQFMVDAVGLSSATEAIPVPVVYLK